MLPLKLRTVFIGISSYHAFILVVCISLYLSGFMNKTNDTATSMTWIVGLSMVTSLFIVQMLLLVVTYSIRSSSYVTLGENENENENEGESDSCLIRRLAQIVFAQKDDAYVATRHWKFLVLLSMLLFILDLVTFALFAQINFKHSE